MMCPFHDKRKPRFFNGFCWYCRKAELRYLSEIEIENGYIKTRPPGLSTQTVTTICRIRRVSRLKKPPILNKRVCITAKNTDGVMSFDEIGQKLGITTQGAEQLYKNAIRKLRDLHPLACVKLLELSNLRQSCVGENVWQ